LPRSGILPVVDRLDRYAALSGLLAFALFGIGNALWSFEVPSEEGSRWIVGSPAATEASDEQIARFYEEKSSGIIVGAGLSLVSIALLVWFGSILRDRLDRIADGRGAGLPLAAFGGLVLSLAAGLGAETINMVGALRAESDRGITPEAAQVYFDVSQVLGFNAAGAGLAVALAATAVIALRAGELLPRWLAILMLLIAVTLFTPLVRVTFAVAFLVLPMISVLLYLDRGATAPAGAARRPTSEAV
jgi:hypothetical protein